jgi:hypothetical protein
VEKANAAELLQAIIGWMLCQDKCFCERRMIMGVHRHIIWDWNGTLLDDVEIVIDAMNVLVKKT